LKGTEKECKEGKRKECRSMELQQEKWKEDQSIK
jgi:hypothetical protein